jgi:hypothetical protein
VDEIRYQGRLVAVVVGGDRALFDPQLEARGFADPLLRFVAAMCRLAMEVELGLEPGPYSDERAERYARELLLPAGEYEALASLPDAYLAARFGVPAEQAYARRSELGLAFLAAGADARRG